MIPSLIRYHRSSATMFCHHKTLHPGKQSQYHFANGLLRKWLLQRQKRRHLVTKRMPVHCAHCMLFVGNTPCVRSANTGPAVLSRTPAVVGHTRRRTPAVSCEQGHCFFKDAYSLVVAMSLFCSSLPCMDGKVGVPCPQDLNLARCRSSAPIYH